GQIGRDLERTPRTHAGTSDPVQTLGITGRESVPVCQVFVVLGLATSHPQGADIRALGIGQVRSQVSAITTVVLELCGQCEWAAVRQCGESQRTGSGQNSRYGLGHGDTPRENEEQQLLNLATRN